MSRTQIALTFGVFIAVVGLYAFREDKEKIYAQAPQDPEEGKKRAIAEGYSIRDRLYASVDKNKDRILDVKERRSLLDSLGFEKVFLNDADPLSVRPTKEGDGRLNIYLSQGFDGYVGTIPYAQAETVLERKK